MSNDQLFNDYKTLVDSAFENAEKCISKINDELLSLHGMSGKMTRHFYNNLLNYKDVRYLEIGVWKGSTVCSAMYENEATVVCVDNWCTFEGPKDEFLNNFNKFKGKNNAQFIENDCFKIDVSTLPKFNIYMYDGEHYKEDHYKSLTHFYDCLDDMFIFIVDDWNWEYVRSGTMDAIKDLNLKILYEKEVLNDNADADPNTWWNGIYIVILQK